MNTREMARRQELCQTLNMNFDEANELFSTETLSSMTMAKVNGGLDPLTKALLSTIAGVALDKLYDFFTPAKGVEPTPMSLTIGGPDSFQLTGTVSATADSILIKRTDMNGIFIDEIRIYNLNIKPTPTQGGGGGASF